jgi:hypothetical protein
VWITNVPVPIITTDEVYLGIMNGFYPYRETDRLGGFEILIVPARHVQE